MATPAPLEFERTTAGAQTEPGTVTFDLTVSAQALAGNLRGYSRATLGVTVAFSFLEAAVLYGTVVISPAKFGWVAALLAADLALLAWFTYSCWAPAFTSLTVDEAGLRLTHAKFPWRNRSISWSSKDLYLRIVDSRERRSRVSNWALIAVRGYVTPRKIGTHDLAMPGTVWDQLLARCREHGLRIDRRVEDMGMATHRYVYTIRSA